MPPNTALLLHFLANHVQGVHFIASLNLLPLSEQPFCLLGNSAGLVSDVRFAFGALNTSYSSLGRSDIMLILLNLFAESVLCECKLLVLESLHGHPVFLSFEDTAPTVTHHSQQGFFDNQSSVGAQQSSELVSRLINEFPQWAISVLLKIAWYNLMLILVACLLFCDRNRLSVDIYIGIWSHDFLSTELRFNLHKILKSMTAHDISDCIDLPVTIWLFSDYDTDKAGIWLWGFFPNEPRILSDEQGGKQVNGQKMQKGDLNHCIYLYGRGHINQRIFNHTPTIFSPNRTPRINAITTTEIKIIQHIFFLDLLELRIAYSMFFWVLLMSQLALLMCSSMTSILSPCSRTKTPRSLRRQRHSSTAASSCRMPSSLSWMSWMAQAIRLESSNLLLCSSNFCFRICMSSLSSISSFISASTAFSRLYFIWLQTPLFFYDFLRSSSAFASC